MAQEEKQLLLKDLCGRLPYGIKVHCEWNMFRGDRISEDGELMSINIYDNSIHFKRNSGRITEIPFNRIDGTVLPYLRPLKSMTEEEQQQLKKLICEHLNGGYPEDEWSAWLLYDKTGIKNGIGGQTFYFYEMPFIYDWLNAHHFDYRGLIEEGFGIEAPEDMYKTILK